MTEFLTIRNFVPKTPMNTGETIWYWFILFLMVVIALYWLADFIRVINEKFFTVKEWQLDMIDEEVRNGRTEQDKRRTV